MQRWLRLSALCYAAGTLGGLAKGGVIWICAQAAITVPLADFLAQGMRPSGLYIRLVWGGLYGLLFLLPFARSSVLMRGLLAAVAVSVFQLLIMPLLQHSNLHLLAFATLALLVLNCVWGLVAAAALRFIE